MQSRRRTAQPHVVVIGGGTGSHVVLTGLRRLGLAPTAVVSMADSGGSSGRLRDEFGHLPPGDVRQCLVALMPDDYQSLVLRQLFMYRFDRGEGLSGHTFGNLLLTALTELTGSLEQAIVVAAELLKIHGSVVPVTLGRSTLCAHLQDGTTLRGEATIDQRDDSSVGIDYVYLDPRVFINPQAKLAIRQADLVVLGPGDLFTSVVPPLLVEGVTDALRESRGRLAYVVNVMTKRGESDGYCAIDFVKTINEYLGAARLDAIVVNTGIPTDRVLARYAQAGQQLVLYDRDSFSDDDRVILADLVTTGLLVRHDPDRLAATLLSLLRSSHPVEIPRANTTKDLARSGALSV
jgi:uncharacterized cofD-like protein